MKKLISTIVVSLFAASAAFAAPPAKKAAPAKSSSAPASKAGSNLERETVGGMNNTNRVGFARNYGLAGCGLGSLVVGPKGGQIFASTTNGTSWSNYFGISSGTSNCVEGPTAAKADQMDKFIVANKIALADDIARGEGETIQGLAQIMNCQNADALGNRLQSNFASIYTSHDLQANEITDRIITVVGQDAQLAMACGVTLSSL